MLSKEPKKIEDILKNFINNSNFNQQYILLKIQKNWSTILGNSIANNCKPINYKDNVLTVKVNSSVWRNELKLRLEIIKELINEYFDKKIVKEIKIR